MESGKDMVSKPELNLQELESKLQCLSYKDKIKLAAVLALRTNAREKQNLLSWIRCV